MARERAQRRAERERAAAAEAAARAEAAERAARKRKLAARVPGRARRGRPDGLLARRRRAQNRVIGLLVAVVQVVGWLLFHSVTGSVALLLLTAVTVPMLVTLVLDRRP